MHILISGQRKVYKFSVLNGITSPKNMLTATHRDSAGDEPVQNSKNRPIKEMTTRNAPTYSSRVITEVTKMMIVDI